MYACYVWKQWEIWLQNCKMDTENNALHVNPKHKWCMKKNLVKLKIFQFRSVERQIRSIENLEKSYFWKTKHFNAETLQSTLFYKKNAWVWDKKFFKNTWIQSRSSKMKIFNQFVLKAQTLNTFCIKIKKLLILNGHNKITHKIMYQV